MDFLNFTVIVWKNWGRYVLQFILFSKEFYGWCRRPRWGGSSEKLFFWRQFMPYGISERRRNREREGEIARERAMTNPIAAQ